MTSQAQRRSVSIARRLAISSTLLVTMFAGGGDLDCPPPDNCPTPTTCIFDGLLNMAAGQAQLSITPKGALRVSNIGASGQDGVIQDPLPPGTTQMTTGMACPNFAASLPGTKAVFKMFADLPVPDGHVSTLTVENIGGMLHANADFSPVGATQYVIQTFIGEHMTGNVMANAGLVILPKVDLNEVSCFWDGPNYVICYKVTWVVNVQIPGFGNFDGDIIYVIDPDGPPCVPQTKVETFLTNTGPLDMTFQYAGPTPPSSKCGPGPGFGPCCQANLGPGCSDPAICACICALEDFCCYVQWDEICAAAVELNGCGDCPGVSSCCQLQVSPGCDNLTCQNTICAFDPFCCDVAWDGICVLEAYDFCGPLCGPIGPPDNCNTPFNCIFDGIPNQALGQAFLDITPTGNLLISNIGSSGQDGVVQNLPPGSQQMVTGVACPNFAFAGPGTQARFLMLGDVPGDLISEAKVVSPNGVDLEMTADFSPVGVTLYTVQIMIGSTWTFAVKNLPQAKLKFPKVDINEMDCRIDNPLHISAKLTCVTKIKIEGVPGEVDGDVIWIIGQNPAVVPEFQTQIVNLFKDTGPVQMTFQYAGAASRQQSACGPAPQVGCCLQANNVAPGCDDAECCAQVCAELPLCCISVWDQPCAALANQICVVNCPADLNHDGVVDGADLGILLARWGFAPGNPADFNGDGFVDGADLGVLLAAWGPCPQPLFTISLVHSGVINGDPFLATGAGTADPATGIVLVDWVIPDPPVNYDPLCSVVTLGGTGGGSTAAREIGSAQNMLSLTGGNYSVHVDGPGMVTDMVVTTTGNHIDVQYVTNGNNVCTGVQSLLPGTNDWVPGPPGSGTFTEQMLVLMNGKGGLVTGAFKTLTYFLPPGVDLPSVQWRNIDTQVLAQSPDGSKMTIRYECSVSPPLAIPRCRYMLNHVILTGPCMVCPHAPPPFWCGAQCGAGGVDDCAQNGFQAHFPCPSGGECIEDWLFVNCVDPCVGG